MIKEIGRLNLDDYKLMDAQVEKIFRNLDKDKIDLARKQITEMANTPNYFVREELGKRLANYDGPGAMEDVCGELLEDHIYGIRATALFYFYYNRRSDPAVDHQDFGKDGGKCALGERNHPLRALEGQSGPDEKHHAGLGAISQRQEAPMSMHGMENIAIRSPQFVLTFIENLIDDESEEVQDKISHVLTHSRALPSFAHLCKHPSLAERRR
jgi:hypothetical protein